MSASANGLDSRPQPTPAQTMEHVEPSFELLRSVYRLRAYSVFVGCGLCLALMGFFLVGISLVVKLAIEQPLLGIDLVALTSGWLTPGIVLLAIGVIVIILDTLKRKLICPYPFEILNDFLRFMCQEKVFPSNGMSKHQFKFRIRKRDGAYRIDFNLNVPGCSFAELRPHIQSIAESFGCGDTYSFTENTGRDSRYARGYSYCFEIVLTSSEKAFAKAGEYRD